MCKLFSTVFVSFANLFTVEFLSGKLPEIKKDTQQPQSMQRKTGFVRLNLNRQKVSETLRVLICKEQESMFSEN